MGDLITCQFRTSHFEGDKPFNTKYKLRWLQQVLQVISLYVCFSESRICLPISIHHHGEIVVNVWLLDEYAHSIFKVTCKAFQGIIKSIYTSITWNILQ
jgi:hypothetical protein